MNAEQLVGYVNNLAGISGSFVVNGYGQILAHSVPEIFDEVMLGNMAQNASHLVESFKSEQPEVNDIFLDIELMSIFVRDLKGELLIIAVNDLTQKRNIRMAANIAAKRFENGKSATVKANLTTEQLNLNTNTQEIQPPPTKKSGLFSMKKKKEKPNNEGGIWG